MIFSGLVGELRFKNSSFRITTGVMQYKLVREDFTRYSADEASQSGQLGKALWKLEERVSRTGSDPERPSSPRVNSCSRDMPARAS
jgi:hypothetical protein